MKYVHVFQSAVATGALMFLSMASAATSTTSTCDFVGGVTATGICEAPRVSFCNAKTKQVVCKGAGGTVPSKPVPKEKPKS